MKKMLPLLAQPQYYSRLKSGKERGGEAVIIVENIRVYCDILNRHEPPYRTLEAISAAPEISQYPPLLGPWQAPRILAGWRRTPLGRISAADQPITSKQAIRISVDALPLSTP